MKYQENNLKKKPIYCHIKKNKIPRNMPLLGIRNQKNHTTITIIL